MYGTSPSRTAMSWCEVQTHAWQTEAQPVSSEVGLVRQFRLVQLLFLIHDEHEIAKIHSLDALSKRYLKKNSKVSSYNAAHKEILETL